MRIILTGASGLVGKNIFEALEAEHYIFAPSRTEIDLSSYDNVLAYIARVNPELVIHCAGLVGGIAANIQNPVNFLIENLDMGRNVILASYKNNVPKLINMGSSCMYPRTAINPLKEESILTGELEPTNEGYALAKIVAERLCRYIKTENSTFDYKTLIPCNLYGSYDKFDIQKAHMVPSIITKLHDAVIEGKDSVVIWGDGTARREFMHIDDLVSFVKFAIQSYEDIPSVINVGLGYDYSVTEYYEIAAKVIGYKNKFVYDINKPSGMKQKLVDVSLASSLGWKANVSLEDGISKTYEYYKKVILKDIN